MAEPTPLTYATPIDSDAFGLRALIRQGLAIWAGVVLARHILFWSMNGLALAGVVPGAPVRSNLVSGVLVLFESAALVALAAALLRRPDGDMWPRIGRAGLALLVTTAARVGADLLLGSLFSRLLTTTGGPGVLVGNLLVSLWQLVSGLQQLLLPAFAILVARRLRATLPGH